jgi:hypothetical protein
MWRYSTFDLDPDADLDEILERYAKAGWQTWAPGRGAVIEQNGLRVRLRRDALERELLR